MSWLVLSNLTMTRNMTEKIFLRGKFFLLWLFLPTFKKWPVSGRRDSPRKISRGQCMKRVLMPIFKWSKREVHRTLNVLQCFPNNIFFGSLVHNIHFWKENKEEEVSIFHFIVSECFQWVKIIVKVWPPPWREEYVCRNFFYDLGTLTRRQRDFLAGEKNKGLTIRSMA